MVAQVRIGGTFVQPELVGLCLCGATGCPKCYPQPARGTELPTKPEPAPSGAELRDKAIAQVDAAYSEWINHAVDAIADLTLKTPHGLGMTEITSDDVWARLAYMDVLPPKEHRAMGAAFSRARRYGWIVPTDRVKPSKMAINHRRPIRVWKVS